MSYEKYLEYISTLTYEEYLIETRALYTMVIAGMIALVGVILWLRIEFKRKLDNETARKLKAISKWEHRDVYQQTKLIIEMFIDAYTQKNNINWDEYLY